MVSALKYWLWLTRLPGLSNQSRLLLLRHFGTPENVYFAEPPEFPLVDGLERQQAALLSNHSLDEAERILDRCQKLNLHLLTLQDANYPERLRNIYDPPCLLYVKGRLPPLDEEIVVSVVGTRNCTPYGVSCAEGISYGLATGGAIVASGLARGIDSAAIRGALLGGGVTIGVLGNGLDVVYPKNNAALYEDVALTGALISEYPPGTGPLPGNFPVRNRILSGIAVGALVVEAPLRSGALITASRALEQGRDVFAVPGPIGAYASQGCNRLIRDGAALVSDAADILETYEARFADKLKRSKEIPVIILSPEAEAEQTVASGGAERGVTANGTERGVASGGVNRAVSPTGAARSVSAPDAKAVSDGTQSVAESGAAENSALPVISVADGDLSPEQALILSLMDAQTPVHVDDLIEQSGLSARQVLSDLTLLQIDGYVSEHSGKRYTRLVELRNDAPTE